MAYQARKIENTMQQRAEEEISIEELKKGDRVNVKVSPMFIFLFRDGIFDFPSHWTHVID